MAKDEFKNFLEDIEDTYGNVTATNEINVISTGSFSLDAYTGVGGICRGKITVIYGVPGSGKTSLCLCTAREAVKLGIKVLYIDAENMLDLEYAEYIVGVKPGDASGMFTVLQPNTAEDNLGIAWKGINSGLFGLVILDSIGALSPKKEKDEVDFEKQDVALVPRLFSKFLRIAFFAVKSKSVALLLVDQVRANIGSYVKSFTMPGGFALEHASSLTILLSRTQEIKFGDVNVGVDVKFTIKKNKMGKPSRSWSFPLIYGEGIDYMRDTVTFAKEAGVLTQAGAYYRLDGDNLGRGINDTMFYLKEHPETLDKIKERVYNVVNKIKTQEGDDIET